MRQGTLDQIMKVISVAAQRYSLGDGIDRSYQYGVSRVSQECAVAYQTIGDACARRLDLDVGEFKTMLKASLEGDTNELCNKLLSKTSSFYHDRINDFFSKLTSNSATSDSTPEKLDTYVTYTVRLRKGDSDVLRALAHLLDSKPEEVLVKVAVDVLKDQMKKTVNEL
ncbi:MAG: hypothetical protein ABFR82_00215 [Nitrospirota bacterium]